MFDGGTAQKKRVNGVSMPLRYRYFVGASTSVVFAVLLVFLFFQFVHFFLFEYFVF